MRGRDGKCLNEAARPARGILERSAERSAGRCCGGEARRDDSPPPCEIDLGGGTGYHESMKKQGKMQADKSEGMKNARGKRTAPKARKATKSGAEAEDELIEVEKVASLEERASDLSYEERLKDEVELRLSNIEELARLSKKIWHAHYEGGLAKVRELLATPDYDGIVARGDFDAEKGRFMFGLVVPFSFRRSTQTFYARLKQDACKLPEKNGLRARELARIEQQEQLQKGADEALCERGEEGLSEYIRQHRERLDTNMGEIQADIAAKPEDDCLYINWKPDIKREEKGAVPVYYPPLEKVLLEEEIRRFHMQGLLNDGSLAKFLSKAGVKIAGLMSVYEVTMDRIYAEAARGLERAKRGDVLFNEDEVFRLVTEENKAKRGQLYNKMRDEKRDFARRFPLCPP